MKNLGVYLYGQNSRTTMSYPNIYFFNPTCELAIANGSFSYMPPLLLQEMERELSALPFVFAKDNDFVLSENIPSAIFIEELTKAGFTLPTFINVNELEFSGLKFGSVFPWGWSPSAHFKLRSLKERCSDEFKNSPGFSWLPEHKMLFERVTSLDFLKKFLKNNPSDFFIDINLTGTKVTEFEEIDQLLTKHSALVIKAPLSSSGRGIQIIRKKELSQPNRQWISGIWKQQNYVIAEPFLEKILDLSFQFQIDADAQINYLGYSIFETNSNGQYKASYINPDLKNLLRKTDAEIIEKMLKSTATLLLDSLRGSVYNKFHRGFLGIDALIFRKGDRLKIQPCLEINSRMTMGVMSKYIERQIHREASGKFELFFSSSGNFSDFKMRQAQLNHQKFKEGKLLSGFFPITEGGSKSKFGAYLSLNQAK